MSSAPNIVFFFCDDLGWGDVSCLNPESKIATPHIDALAASGMSFTDAHAGSAVCTPSRYTLLTGRYCWRTRLKEGVNGGYSPSLIPPDRPTVASELRSLGDATACIGKWHLGLDWALKPDAPPELGPHQEFTEHEGELDPYIDFTQPVRGGPVDVGFDHFFGISASLDMSPYVYIHDDRVTEPPTSHSPGGTAELRARPGIAAPGWRHEDVLPELERRACAWIAEQHAADHPFFLYLPINGPHTPVVPTDEWKGRSGCGIYGDFVMQIDAVVGSLIAELEKLGIRENTLFVFSSDNGPETITAPYRERYGHKSAWEFRGMKRDNWEGGHRIPLIASWPAAIRAGSRCDRFVELADFYMTALDIGGHEMTPLDVGGHEMPPPDARPRGGEDSFSMLPLLQGGDASAYRQFAVHHSMQGKWAIRKGRWKLLLHSGSGGNPYDCPENDDPVQLYDMESDPFETTNVYRARPETVRELKELCLAVIRGGRSTPGPALANDPPAGVSNDANAAAGDTGAGRESDQPIWHQLQELLELELS